MYINIHPGDIKENKELIPCEFTLITYFFNEFNNDPNVRIINAGPLEKNGINFYNAPIELLIHYVKNNVSSNTKLLFDNVFEGNVNPALDIIYRIIESTDLKAEQCHYFTSALDANAVLDEYCKTNNITEKIKMYICTTWENHIKTTTVIQDIKYNIREKSKIYLCFNRVFRYHRFALVCLLSNKNLIKDSYYSFFMDGAHGGIISLPVSELMHGLQQWLSPEITNTILDSYEKTKHLFPLKLNIDKEENVNFIKPEDIEFFEQSYFSLVTETYYFPWKQPDLIDSQTIFFSEKIFKPIVMKHPFILVSRPHSLRWLKTLNYKTFHPYIDESYDSIEDDEDRMLAIVNEVERLSKFTTAEWIQWQTNVAGIVEHNYNILQNKKKHDFVYYRPN